MGKVVADADAVTTPTAAARHTSTFRQYWGYFTALKTKKLRKCFYYIVTLQVANLHVLYDFLLENNSNGTTMLDVILGICSPCSPPLSSSTDWQNGLPEEKASKVSNCRPLSISVGVLVLITVNWELNKVGPEKQHVCLQWPVLGDQASDC